MLHRRPYRRCIGLRLRVFCKGAHRRYRYYVSQATLKFQENRVGSVERVSAHAIETVVTRDLLSLLEDGPRLLDKLGSTQLPISSQSALLDQARTLVLEWKEKLPDEKVSVINSALQKITVGTEKVELIYNRCGLLTLLGASVVSHPELHQEISDEIEVTLDVSFQRCGIESKIIVQGATTDHAHPRTVQAIQNALHHALEWNAELISGNAASMKSVANRHGVSQCYLSDQLKLAWLSPDIMKAIFNGKVPSTLSLVKLKKGFPLAWDQQSASLGFSTL